MRKWLVIVGSLVLALALGIAVAVFVDARRQDAGHLETEVTDVTLQTAAPRPKAPVATTPEPPPPPEREGPCWMQFGGDPARSLARPDLVLGPPVKPVWARGLGSYIEYPAVYCDGLLYVNVFEGITYAVEAESGRIVWRTPRGGAKPSAPAISGQRLIVSSNDGTVTAYERFRGNRLWRLDVGSRVESSPLVIDGRVYFGSADGRLFAVEASTGKVRWAFDTGATINSSPSAFGNGVCITNYGGAIFCLRRSDGQKQWSTYVSRDFARYESFYASASTDGQRLFTISRSGKVVALDGGDGRILWTHRQSGLGYTTPAVSGGRVFVGGFDGALHAYDADTGRPLWSRYVGGRVLGAPVLIGTLVFFSTLEKRTFAVRATNGEVVWRAPMGKYSPTIATREHYYMTLNGMLVSYRASDTGERTKPKTR